MSQEIDEIKSESKIGSKWKKMIWLAMNKVKANWLNNDDLEKRYLFLENNCRQNSIY
jgi:hypothetical protein